MKKIALYLVCLLPFIANAETSTSIMMNYIVPQPNKSSIMPHSIFKSGDMVNFTLRAGGLFHQISYECETQNLFINYIDGLGGENKRQYSQSQTEYMQPIQIIQTQNHWIAELPEVQKSCQSTPDYRVVSRDQSPDNPKVVVIDINDVQKSEDRLTLWTYYPENAILYDTPYNAPYSYKAQKVMLSCLSGKRITVHSYDVQHDFVSDGTLLLMQHSVADKELTKNICDSKNWQQLNKYSFSSDLPYIMEVQEMVLSEELSKLMQPFQISPPKYRVSKITTSATHSRTHLHPVSPRKYTETVVLDAMSEPNFFKETVTRDNYRAEIISFLGFPLITKTTGFEKIRMNVILKDMQISKKMDQLFAGTKFNYSIKIQLKNALTGLTEQYDKYSCQVLRVLPGTELHSNIKGNAKEIYCSKEEKEDEQVLTLFYLDDYHYTINLKLSLNEFESIESQIVKFE